MKCTQVYKELEDFSCIKKYSAYISFALQNYLVRIDLRELET